MLLKDSRRFCAQATYKGVVLAKSAEYFEYEGRVYFPWDSVNFEYLVPTETSSVCPSKGRARYFTIKVGDREIIDGAFSYPKPHLLSYPKPKKAARPLTGKVAFWKSVAISKIQVA